MKAANKTDIGRVRTVNEDRAVVQLDLHGFTFAVVADGMGGHQAGDVASQMTIEYLQEQLMQHIHADMTVEEQGETMRSLIQAANAHVFERANSAEQLAGMGTTVVAVLAGPSHIVIAHIGDSRAYAVHGSEIIQLTEDHSLVNELLKTGQITEEEAANHPRRNVLIRALGTDPAVDIDIKVHHWEYGDSLLLCSDGLSSYVGQESIVHTLQLELPLQLKVDRLIEQALEAGGDDNVTVVLLINEAEADSSISSASRQGKENAE